MHSRRLASLLLGLWLGGALLAAWVAAMNRRSPERLMAGAAPAARLEFKSLGPNAARALDHYAAEQNRALAKNWGRAQLITGAALFLFLLFGTPEKKGRLTLALAMLVFTAVQRLLLAPQMDALGQLMDYAPAGIDSGGSKQSGFSTAYSILEALKWMAGGVLALELVRRHAAGKVRAGGGRPAGVNRKD